jgi:hypothetical protein
MNELRSEIEPVRTRKRRSRHRHPKRKPFFWLLIILLITFMLSAFAMSIPSLADKYLNFTDKAYRLTDSDIMHYKQEMQKSETTK